MSPADAEAPPGWFDAHCHLDMIEREPKDVVASARDGNVLSMVTIGTDVASSKRAVEIAGSTEEVWAAVGVHPHDASGLDQAALAEIDRLSGDPKVVAIGEIGLDFYRDLSPRDAQRQAFSSQLDLAAAISKTVVIHMRDAHEEVYSMLAENPPERLVFHCFSGGAAEARRALDLGGHLSFAGNISYPKSEELREAARVVPLDRLMVETDSPFLSPAPNRGRPNEPANVASVGTFLAEVVGRSPQEIAEATTANSRRVFGL